ncbi:2-isopropylmalate synthase [Entomortierella parvispora]|uniref:2-isopropylmalate synthase n=1 Tax=Entomortierella parvispora TaxID=205924 RepID=A0A9P3H5E5_9FUNG|nr:2-isopropylmalate synthase [Entomortierella parvispora]
MTIVNNSNYKDKLIIFDTTLRDGEQSPGVTLTVNEKIEIAKQLSSLGVDILEAGFPVASQGDFDAVERIATEVGPLMVGREAIGKPMTIAGLARAVPADIKRCFDAIANAPNRRIHTFLATSDIHLQHKLKITREECITRAVAAVSFAKTLVDDVEFSPEDAGRSDQDFLCKVLSAVIEAGATTLNIPDTVGYNMPEEYGAMIKYLIANTKGSDKVIWSAHCHNDLGLATANTLSGIMNGIRQVEVTINGIGERAGNTAMEEVVMAVHTHPDFFPVYHTINTPQFFRISQMVSSLSGMAVQPNKAIVGANAFLHESGIHQDGVLKNKTTYEIISPETVGANTINLVLGKHSGRAAFRSRLQALGFDGLDDTEFQAAFNSFKTLADSKKRVTEQDLIALLSDQVSSASGEKPTYIIKSLQVVSGTTMASATVELQNTTTGEDIADAATGKAGPVEAVYKAIQRLVGKRIRLLKFDITAVGEGVDALGQVSVKIAEDSSASSDSEDAEEQGGLSKATYHGHGTDSDIIQAATKAYVNAINRLVANENERLLGERKVDV